MYLKGCQRVERLRPDPADGLGLHSECVALRLSTRGSSEQTAGPKVQKNILSTENTDCSLISMMSVWLKVIVPLKVIKFR